MDIYPNEEMIIEIIIEKLADLQRQFRDVDNLILDIKYGNPKGFRMVNNNITISTPSLAPGETTADKRLNYA